MRIAFDATPIVAGNTGVARYTARLLDELSKRSDLDLAPFAIGRGQRPPASVRHLRLPLRIAHATWPRLAWPSAESLVGRVDALHALDMIPAPTKAPVVLTVHDVLPSRLPHLYSDRARLISARNLEAARRASVLLADCNATAEEVANATGRALGDVVVAPPGPLLAAPNEASNDASSTAPPYVLAVGSVTPRKGFATLARALAKLGDPPPLVIVGPDGWRAREVRGEVSAALGERVRFLGWVPDETLAALYRQAMVFAFPSVAEGFGIPVLEALALGAPVVAADLPPVREVAAGAAVLVDPANEEALAGALDEVLSDDVRRGAMSSAGRAVAAGYSWTATADGVVDAYRRATTS